MAGWNKCQQVRPLFYTSTINAVLSTSYRHVSCFIIHVGSWTLNDVLRYLFMTYQTLWYVQSQITFSSLFICWWSHIYYICILVLGFKIFLNYFQFLCVLYSTNYWRVLLFDRCYMRYYSCFVGGNTSKYLTADTLWCICSWLCLFIFL